MTILCHKGIQALIEAGHIQHADPACINAASLDVRLGPDMAQERGPSLAVYAKRQGPIFTPMVSPFVLRPGVFCLGHTVEAFDLPDNVAAIFRTKSSMGRIGLEHMDAGFVDPGFHGVLTLEFKNATQYTDIQISPGDRVGQLIFFQLEAAVDPWMSYRAKGSYNGFFGIKTVGGI